MKAAHILGIGAAAAMGAGALLFLTAALSRPPRRYHRGLIAGDSMNATPILTRALEQTTGIRWDNVAVAGRNSSQILQQVRRGFRPGVHDVVVVSVGGNDGGRALATTQRNIQALVDYVQNNGADVVLFTEPPFRSYRGARPAAVRRSEASRMWVLGGSTGARFVIDLHELLGGGSPYLLARLDGGDGLHPNRAGRELLARAVARYVRAA